MRNRTWVLIGGGLLAGALALAGLSAALAQTSGYGFGSPAGGGSGHGPGMMGGGSGHGPGMMGGGGGYGPGMMGGGSGYGPGMMGGGGGKRPASAATAVASAPAGTTGASTEQATLAVRIVEASGAVSSWGYSPATLTVRVGDTVTWTNTGSIAHTVTADDGSFDSRLLSHGSAWSMTFATAGTYSYHCAPHPWMKGTVIVQ